MNKKLIWVIPGLVLALGGVAWLSARPLARRSVQTGPIQPIASPPAAMQPTTIPIVGTPTVTPSLITVSTPTQVLVTTQITDPSLISGSANLLRLGATGTQPTVLGVMHDDGLNGDVVANDKTFSLQVNFNEATASQLQLQVSAAFRGLLKRGTSNVVSIDVWNTITAGGTSGAFTAIYPPSWTSEPLAANFANNGASGIAISAPDDDEGDNGITVESFPGHISDLVADLNARYSLTSDSVFLANNISWRILRHSEADSGQQFFTAATEKNGIIYSMGAKDIASNSTTIQTMLTAFRF